MNSKKLLWQVFVFILITLLLSGCGSGQLFGPTVTPTSTQTPLPTSTPTPIPSPTKNPLPPLSIDADNCSSMEQDSSIGIGRIVLVMGNLTVPAGSFDLNVDQYKIWLTKSSFIDDDQVRLDVLIPGGNKSNSMYFDEKGVPRIKNNTGEILNWQTMNGYDVYKTYASVIVTGTWLGECPFKIDEIRYRY